MAQAKETAALLISVIVTGTIIGGGGWWFLNRANNPSTTGGLVAPLSSNNQASRFSDGAEILTDDINPNKQAAVEAVKSGDLPRAITLLEAALSQSPNDPEALIYLQNLKAEQQSNSYAIAVAIPAGPAMNIAKEILRGVAQAQKSVNESGGINGVPLKVLLINDDDDPEVVAQVAQTLVSNHPEILGVVGHYSSDSSLAAATVYEAGGLTMISPTSTSVELSTAGDYIFRTVPSDRFAGSALAQYQLNRLQKQRAAVFYNSQSAYSQSIKNVFTTDLFGQGGNVVGEFDLASSGFNAQNALQQAIAAGAEVLMLAPSSAVIDQMIAIAAANQNRLPLLAGDDAYSAEVLQKGGGNVAGMVVAIPWHILGNPGAAFPKEAQQLWGGEVNWRTAMAYDATQALVAAIGRSPNRAGVKAALGQSDFVAPGSAGEVRFLPSGDRNQAVQLVKIQAGTRTSFGYEFVPVDN
ncbi:ABC transporter substrate-binding protein [Spirulina sp. CCNP1310]|uniref:ABC transporter substrate-binding protein n=1 Tax=Spirulina sp. CCNP1310 TaxID=3110249 RepID=UPI002B1FA27C|nr:ABC transporter substrate-binding protein [Spirulina sp. CCNP1310]MEA5421178.1 ABC transporter substrate-binding protein [Spirulina sp. CCNP1310]